MCPDYKSLPTSVISLHHREPETFIIKTSLGNVVLYANQLWEKKSIFKGVSQLVAICT